MTDLHETYVESQGELFDDIGRKPRLALVEEPSTPDRMLQFFTYTHLPLELQAASAPFCELARLVASSLPSTPERTVCLRKLLEAKDAAVRTLLYRD